MVGLAWTTLLTARMDIGNCILLVRCWGPAPRFGIAVRPMGRARNVEWYALPMKSAVAGSVAAVFCVTFAWVTLGAASQTSTKSQAPAKSETSKVQAPTAPAGV